MSILTKLTLRSLKLNRKRTIVTIIGVILSGAMIIGVASIAASFQDLFIQSAIVSGGNYHAKLYDVAFEQVEDLRQQGLEAVMINKEAGFAVIEKADVERSYLNVCEFDRESFNSFPLKLVAGRLPQRKGELVVTEEMLEYGYEIGETVELTLGERYLEGMQLTVRDAFQEGEEWQAKVKRSYTICGIIEDPSFMYNAAGFSAFSYLEEDALASGELVNVALRVKNVRGIYDDVPLLAEQVGAVDYGFHGELLRWSGVSANDYAMQFLGSITLIIIVLIVVGSVAVIYNAFAISVSERKKQFGMLSSVGAEPGQIRSIVFSEGLLLGVVGIPLGILAGLVGIGVTLKVVNRLLLGSMFSDDVALRLVIFPVTIGITIIFEALIIFLSAWLPAKRAAKISPIDAIRLQSDINIKAKEVKTSKLTRRLFGLEGDLALKNIKRNRKQYRATVFSLFISIVLFVSFSSFMEYGFISRDMYYGGMPYDLIVNCYDAKEQEDYLEKLLALPGIQRAAVVHQLPLQGKFSKEQLGSYLQENMLSDILPQSEMGEYLLNVNLVTIGEKEFAAYAKEHGLKVADFQHEKQGILINKNVLEGKVAYTPLAVSAGETLQLVEYQYSEEQPVDFSLKIGAVTEELPYGVNYTGHNAVNILLTEEVLASIAAELHEYNQNHLENMSIYLSSSDSAVLREEIRSLGEEFGGNYYLTDVSALQAEMKRTSTVMAIFLYGFVTLITLIGITNIFNTISTNVLLRRREFAMLRSVGLTPQGLQKIIRFESLFYGLKALSYGLPVSILISVWMYNSFANLFTFSFVIPWREIIICIVGVLLVTFLTMRQASSKFGEENITAALGLDYCG